MIIFPNLFLIRIILSYKEYGHVPVFTRILDRVQGYLN